MLGRAWAHREREVPVHGDVPPEVGRRSEKMRKEGVMGVVI